MRKILKHILFSLVTSVVIYCLTSFIKWDFYWLLKASEWSVDDRMATVLLFICKQTADICLLNILELENVL